MEAVPEKIQQMLDLYDYRISPEDDKSENFYRQGKFMEDYEDDKPWSGSFSAYNPTYHDLNLAQLRGYFTWRTRLRHGEFQPAPDPFVCLYLYELLNGIGTSSPRDGLKKMLKFEKEYVDKGMAGSDLKDKLHSWIHDFVIIHKLPAKYAVRFSSASQMERDQPFCALKNPAKYSDEEIFAALCQFQKEHTADSRAVIKHGQEVRSLFGQIWRFLQTQTKFQEKDIFTACFGLLEEFWWKPFRYAVYYEESLVPRRSYAVNECRSYRCDSQKWYEKQYQSWTFNETLFTHILHAIDERLRRYFQTGPYLHQMAEEAWLLPGINAVIEKHEQEKQKALHPELPIDYSSLG